MVKKKEKDRGHGLNRTARYAANSFARFQILLTKETVKF